MQYFVYLFAAYTFITLAMLGFVLSMVRKQERLNREIETLKKMLEAKSEATQVWPASRP
ncbi:MAG: CcmD family protein [Chloroflexi bacterium]|nr:CcmD family protein [Chloroflexota bacterium]